jgi:ribosomal protein S18 acetylase RimI-like enzyme
MPDADPELLDDPVWHALTGPHRRFAVAPNRGDGSARAYRYRRDVGPFATVRDVADPDAWRDLAEVCESDDRVALVAPNSVGPSAPPAGWALVTVLLAAQMVAPANGSTLDAAPESVVALGSRDVDEMMSLAELTHPGPFGVSTVSLGGYLGVRRDNRLVAMAGRRLSLPGWIEISAVCTHPDHRGQGLAGLLIAAVDAAIRRQGSRAFLHVIHGNTGAYELYRRLGFTTRTDVTFTVVRVAPE